MPPRPPTPPRRPSNGYREEDRGRLDRDSRPRLPQDASWLRHQRQDGEDHRRRGRRPREAPLYGKVIRRTSKVKVHDEANSAGVGDLVVISETRPLSASKRWRLVEILEKAK
ncbi:small ribosomal subunit protein uS17 [Frondihabitans sucicola]|uniref:small ribosomal subunit protein uS17 n=1 Tax=Frondihabitans sucicola TaxID=1268041 RepID=UPI003305B86F